MRRLSTVAVAAVVLLVVSGTASGTQTPTLVLGGSKIDQLQPAASTGYLSWDQNSTAKPRHYDNFAAAFPLGGSSPVRLNRPNTQGWSGGITGDTTESIYQEVANGDSNLYMYDLGTDTRTDPAAGINTNKWEWAASISPGYIEFGRQDAFKQTAPSRVLLYDRSAGLTTVLASEPVACYCISPYQVTDRYATWLVCKNLCRVWYYDIAAAKIHELADPLGLDQYDPSVDGATGTLYYVQAHGNWCGTHVKLVRWTIGTPISSAVTVSAIPLGYDIGASTYVSVDQGHDDVFFDRVRCSGPHYADIYEVASADTAPVTIRFVAGTGSQGPAARSRMRAGAPAG